MKIVEKTISKKNCAEFLLRVYLCIRNRISPAYPFHLGVPYYQAEITPVEPDQVMLFRKGK
jgi:hypothetical protein